MSAAAGLLLVDFLDAFAEAWRQARQKRAAADTAAERGMAREAAVIEAEIVKEAAAGVVATGAPPATTTATPPSSPPTDVPLSPTPTDPSG